MAVNKFLSQALLYRFSVRTLTDRSPTDATQIPVGASIDFYHQGASCNATSPITIPASSSNTPIPVYDLGRLLPGSLVRVYRGVDLLAPVLTIGTLQEAQFQPATGTLALPTVLVSNPGATPVTIGLGDRLVITTLNTTTPRPLTTTDPIGTVPTSSPGVIATDSATGFGACYIAASVFDYVVTIGQKRILHADIHATPASALSPLINARHFPSIAAAVAALPPFGGTVLIPAGIYDLDAASSPIVLNKPNVTLLGEGYSSEEHTAPFRSRYVRRRTILRCAYGAHTSVIRIEADRCSVRNLTITQKEDESQDEEDHVIVGSAVGIEIGHQGQRLSGIVLRDLHLLFLPNMAIRFGGTNSIPPLLGSSHCIVENVRARNALGLCQIYVGAGNEHIVIRKCIIEAEKDLVPPSPDLHPCLFVLNPRHLLVDTCEGIPALNAPWLHVMMTGTEPHTGGATVIVRNCDIERPPGPGSEYLIRASGTSHLRIEGTLFFDAPGGVYLAQCYQPQLVGNLFKLIGGTPSNPNIQDCLAMFGTANACLMNNSSEAADGDPDFGARRELPYYDDLVDGSYGTCAFQQGTIRIPNRSSSTGNEFPKKGYMFFVDDGVNMFNHPALFTTDWVQL